MRNITEIVLGMNIGVVTTDLHSKYWRQRVGNEHRVCNHWFTCEMLQNTLWGKTCCRFAAARNTADQRAHEVRRIVLVYSFKASLCIHAASIQHLSDFWKDCAKTNRDLLIYLVFVFRPNNLWLQTLCALQLAVTNTAEIALGTNVGCVSIGLLTRHNRNRIGNEHRICNHWFTCEMQQKSDWKRTFGL